MDLLLLADPSEELVNHYLDKVICYTAENKGETVSVILYMETKPYTMEIMNLPVKEELHYQGIGKNFYYTLTQIKKGDPKPLKSERAIPEWCKCFYIKIADSVL